MKTYFYFKILALFALVLELSSCSTTSTFNVKSDPLQADVYFKLPKNGEKKTLGKTPIQMPMAELKQTLGDELAAGQYFTLIIEKQGFKSETVMIPASRFGTMMTDIEVSLKKGNDDQEEKLAKDVLNRLFLAQKFALTQQFERAQIELDKILVDYPKFSRAMSMRASIFYVQKNYQESLKWYEEALKVDPQMDEAVKMTAKVRSALGGRLPAEDRAATSTGGKP